MQRFSVELSYAERSTLGRLIVDNAGLLGLCECRFHMVMKYQLSSCISMPTAHEYTWSNQPPLGDTVSSAGMGKTTDDVIVKPEGENPQTSLQNLWPSHPMGQTAALDDPLSSSPFSQVRTYLHIRMYMYI